LLLLQNAGGASANPTSSMALGLHYICVKTKEVEKKESNVIGPEPGQKKNKPIGGVKRYIIATLK
jgi:hypothetical protein